MGKTYQSIVVNAPVDKVWHALRNFHDLSWASDVITKLDVKGDKQSDQIGTSRVLNDAFHETLVDLNDLTHTLSYSIDDGPSPLSRDEVRNYYGTVRVSAITEGDGGTFVQWSSRWDQNDAAVHEFCSGIYVALLGCLKDHFS